jgi:hypothetical protein
MKMSLRKEGMRIKAKKKGWSKAGH